MQQNLESKLMIFTDGAALGNPGPGGYGAVLVFPVLDEVVELGGNKAHTTNNEMELSAVVAALAHAAINVAPTEIYTDSSYVVNGITKWVKSWEKNNWMTAAKEPVSHRALWESLVSLVQERESVTTVSWHLLPGHAGIPGNERADKIATGFGKGENVKFYRGRLGDYDIDVLDTTVDEKKLAAKKDKRERSNAKAYSYLSLVDGVMMRHATWAECEARVKGKPAKFKKALSSDEEKEIARDWGVELPN